MTGADLLESWYGFLLVAGNAYVEAVGSAAQLRELHALRPDRMKVVPGAGRLAGGLRVHGRRAARCASRARLSTGVRPILHLRLFHPVNDHYGLSPIEAAATAIDIHNDGGALEQGAARQFGAAVGRAGLCGRATGS